MPSPTATLLCAIAIIAAITATSRAATPRHNRNSRALFGAVRDARALQHRHIRRRLLLAARATHPQRFQGLSGELCTSDASCADARVCLRLDDSITPCPSSSARAVCVCLPSDPRDAHCSCANPICLPGDRCVDLTAATACVSVALALPPAACVSATSVSTHSDGLTGAPCATDDDCSAARVCLADVQGDLDAVVPCSDAVDDGCLCVPTVGDVSCDCDDDDCSEGEVCAAWRGIALCVPTGIAAFLDECVALLPTGTASVETTLLASPGADASPGAAVDAPPAQSPSPSPTTGVCVDARALAHLDSHQLRYARHVTGRVLCDRFGSCATPGHIVVYRGRSMMMSKYCEMVACEDKVMLVNSPRYSRGLRVPSKTDALQYTVFAARYGTRAEQAVMAAAVRVGL